MSSNAAWAVLASPRKREILRLVWSSERRAGQIHEAMPDVSFAAVSLQLRSLTEAGLVTVRSEGRQRLYRARPEALGPAGQMLEVMWSDALSRLKIQAELDEARRGPRPGFRGGTPHARRQRPAASRRTDARHRR